MAWLILLLVGARLASAEAPAIQWDQARRLTWDDFVGSVPADAASERVATTAASLSWSNRYAITWSRDTCLFRITELRSAALFHPETSWVRPDHRNARVLEHEQGHFDIAEIYRQRFEAETREVVGPQRECRGRTERQAARYAERAVDELVGAVYEDIWGRYRAEQETYDRETRHGIDVEEQARWTRSIAARLGPAAAFVTPVTKSQAVYP